MKSCFIRGSVIRYIQIPPEEVDLDLLHEATRREAALVAQRESTSVVSQPQSQ